MKKLILALLFIFIFNINNVFSQKIKCVYMIVGTQIETYNNNTMLYGFNYGILNNNLYLSTTISRNFNKLSVSSYGIDLGYSFKNKYLISIGPSFIVSENSVINKNLSLKFNYSIIDYLNIFIGSTLRTDINNKYDRVDYVVGLNFKLKS